MLCRIQNLNSAKVLAVEGGSAANSARIVQFADNGTTSHLWRNWIGQRWAGGSPNQTDWRTQASALSALL